MLIIPLNNGSSEARGQLALLGISTEDLISIKIIGFKIFDFAPLSEKALCRPRLLNILTLRNGQWAAPAKFEEQKLCTLISICSPNLLSRRFARYRLYFTVVIDFQLLRCKMSNTNANINTCNTHIRGRRAFSPVPSNLKKCAVLPKIKTHFFN